MAATVNWKELVIAILGAVAVGVSVGLGAGFAARALGWPTGFAGPLTGGLVSVLLLAFYTKRTQRNRGGA